MSKPLDVQCQFIFQSGCKKLSHGHFKILVQECSWLGDVIDPKLFVSLLYISIAMKASLMKFNMLNMFENTISKIFLDFF